MDILDIAIAKQLAAKGSVQANQGSENEGKFLGISGDGSVVPVSGDPSSVTAGDVSYNSSTNYSSGTVGKAVKDLQSDTTELDTDVSSLKSDFANSEMWNADLTVNDFISYKSAAYVKYSDGSTPVSGVYLGYYYMTNDGFTSVTVKVYAKDAASAAIAFYTTDTPSTDGYIKASSVVTSDGWHTYTVNVPANAKLIAFTHRTDYRTGEEGTPTISFTKKNWYGALYAADEIRNYVDSDLVIHFAETSYSGYYSDSGSVQPAGSTTQERYSLKERVIPGMKIHAEVNCSVADTMWFAYMQYDRLGTVVGSRQGVTKTSTNRAELDITVPDGVYNIAFCWRSYGDTNAFTASAYFSGDYAIDLMTPTPANVIYSGANTSITKTVFSNKHIKKGVYMLDCSALTVDYAVLLLNYSNSDNKYDQEIYAAKGQKKLVCVATDYIYDARCTLSEYAANQTISFSYVGEIDERFDSLATIPSRYYGALPTPNVQLNKYWTIGGIADYTGRIAIGLFDCYGSMHISMSDTTNYKFAVITYDKLTMTRTNDSDWITTGSFDLYCGKDTVVGITLVRVSGAITDISEYTSAGFTFTSPDGYYYPEMSISDLNAYKAEVSDRFDAQTYNISNGVNGLRFKPMYDHLFVNRTGANSTIPHESLYHIRLSKAMGFDVIEANVARTSDNVMFVNHLSSGKFGGYFHHVDGITDISDAAANSVTWDYIVSNVRYNSSFAKYQTRPCLLSEFLGECRKQNIIPFIYSATADMIKMADDYMGKNNYIAYGATRALCPTGIIYQWMNKPTKAEILAYCDTFGAPFIYGMSNPTSFTDNELRDIVDTLHEHGYWIGVSYADGLWHKYAAMGFDFNGTQTRMNRIENGNICNLRSITGFDAFDYTNATETDGVLTYSASGTLTPKIDNTTYDVCGIDFEMWFSGTIILTAIGEATSNVTYTSDGSSSIFASIPIVNGSPKVTFTAAQGTEIYDMTFKASRF